MRPALLMRKKCKYYREKSCSRREVNQGARVVKDLVKEIENCGRSITCNDFSSSVSPARELLQKKLTVVGNIRKNKPELPQQSTVVKDCEITSIIFEFLKDTMIAPFCTNRGCVVNMLSTTHFLPKIASNSREKA